MKRLNEGCPSNAPTLDSSLGLLYRGSGVGVGFAFQVWRFDVKTLTDRFSLDAKHHAIQEALRAGWPMVYGYTIDYTDADGSEGSYSVDVCRTNEEAQRKCIESALRFGWTYPRWWQWWRWGDTRPPKDIVEEIAAAQTQKGQPPD